MSKESERLTPGIDASRRSLLRMAGLGGVALGASGLLAACSGSSGGGEPEQRALLPVELVVGECTRG